jgi:hypothetical protein
LDGRHDRVSRHAFGEISETALLVLEVRAGAEEVLGVDIEDVDNVAELSAEAAKKFDNELLVGDGVADIMEGVSEDLQLAIRCDRAIVLEQLMELLPDVGDMLQTIVVKEVLAHVI